MGGNDAGNSVKRTQEIPCLALPEASSDDCSAVHPYPSIADNHATSEQLAAKQTSAAQSKLPSIQLLRGKRKHPEPSPTLEEAQLKSQLSSNPEARQESSVQTPAPETLVSPNKRKGRRKSAKATSAAEASAQSTPTAGKSRKKHDYAGVMGRTVDIPAHVFAVDIPDLFYRGVVLKKDRAHTGAVIIRFTEDGSRYWFPLTEVERFLRDMKEHGRDKGSETIGQGSDAFAAEILAGALAARRKTSDTSASSATAGSYEAEVSTGGHPCRAQPHPEQSSHLNNHCTAEQEASEQEAASLLEELAAAADSGALACCSIVQMYW